MSLIGAIDNALARIGTRYRSRHNSGEWESFRDRFAKEEDCIAFLCHIKWPTGFSCPRCQYGQAYVVHSRRLPIYQCVNCRHQTSLTVGTIMEKSRTSLSKWLYAFLLVSSMDSDLNAVQLQERIQVTYKTAWTMLHSIRQAISNADSEQLLSGDIRGGVGFCGQLPYSSTMTRDPQEKPILFSASVDKQGQPFEFKMKVVDVDHMKNKHLERAGIREFIKRNVNPDVQEIQFHQRFSSLRIQPLKDLFDLTMYRFIRSYRGLCSRHLQLYLDEACYRINLTLQNIPIFESLINLCMTTQRFTITTK